MFKKILIADRSEIALRVIRTCREMGVRKLALILGVVMAIGCGQDTTVSTNDAIDGRDTTATTGHDQGPSVPYFDFDEVDHYFAPLDEDVLSFIPEKEEWGGVINNLPDDIRLTWEIVVGNEPQGIPEHTSVFIDKLEDIGYTRTVVDTTYIAALNDIFREKPEDPNAESTSCIPVYRDILLFKRDGKVVGIAKICFDCLKSHIVGTEANTWNFGQHGDYGRLAKIL